MVDSYFDQNLESVSKPDIELRVPDFMDFMSIYTFLLSNNCQYMILLITVNISQNMKGYKL